jgi:hypothetical protein
MIKSWMESPVPRASSPRRSALPAARHGGSTGLARDLLISIIEPDHILLLSNEMLYEIVVPDTLLITPIRDMNDTVLMQMAVNRWVKRSQVSRTTEMAYYATFSSTTKPVAVFEIAT